jgi:hypothetical protein
MLDVAAAAFAWAFAPFVLLALFRLGVMKCGGPIAWGKPDIERTSPKDRV